MIRTTVLASDLSRAECEERVRASTAEDKGAVPGGVLTGVDSGAGIVSLRTSFGFRLRLAYGLSPRCFVTFTPSGAGTLIELRTRMHFYPMLFMFIWLTGVIAIGGYIFVASALALLGVTTGSVRPVTGLLVPPIFFMFAFVFVRHDRSAVAATEATVRSFLSRELGAHDVAAAQQRVAADRAAPGR